MNKVIVSLGCSWTYGHGLSADQTYSAHLQKRLPEYKIVNAGHCGSDIDYAIFSGVKLIEKYDPEVVIFQLTSFDRMTLGTDGFENFLKNDVVTNHTSRIYYDTNTDYTRLIGINDGIKTKYTHGSYISSTADKKEELESSGMKHLDFKKYKNFVDTLYENVVYSDYEIEKRINNLFLFKEYLESKKIKSLWFLWTPNTNVEFFKKFFKKETFIETPVLEWLKQYFPNNNFFIDNGYHISEKGNMLLAVGYILPKLKPLL